MVRTAVWILTALTVNTLAVLNIRPVAADDTFLFEKDGFRIHYVGNGGNCYGCDWIAIDGRIPADAGEYLQGFIERNDLQGIHVYVYLNSPGGSLIGAIRLGRVIRNLGLNTAVAKTVRDGRWYATKTGECYSACAYAFLGGVQRLAGPGEYGVHQFYQAALLQNPEGKVFTPIDFSVQQVTTGLLLSYVMEMGASAQLVVEANKTLPTDMNLLSKQQLIDFKVSFDPDHYGPWGIEAARNGLVAFSRSHDDKRQITIYCAKPHRPELLITYKDMDPSALEYLKSALRQIRKLALLQRTLMMTSVRSEIAGGSAQLHLSLTSDDIQAIELDNDPDGAVSVHPDEARAYYNAIHENISLEGLTSAVQLSQRNCLN